MRKKSKQGLLEHNTVVATASMVIRNKLEFNDKLVYHIIHSIVYGLVN